MIAGIFLIVLGIFIGLLIAQVRTNRILTEYEGRAARYGSAEASIWISRARKAVAR